MANFELISPNLRKIYAWKLNSFNVGLEHRKMSVAYRLMAILEGGYTLRMGDTVDCCRAGDLVYLIPGQEYITTFDYGRSEFVSICFDFYAQPDVRSDKDSSIRDFHIMLNYDPLEITDHAERLEFGDVPKFNSSFVVHEVPDLESKVREIHHLYKNENQFSHLRQNAKLLELLADVAEYSGAVRKNSGKLSARTIVNYINANYSKPLTCRSVAEHFSYHPNYVNRIVRELTGRSLHDYIVYVKIQHANQLLLETDMSITDIAYQLAFHDSSHFSSVYQAHTGMKPTERRRMFVDPGKL